MKMMNEQQFAVLRRHMVEVIAIDADLSSEELGKAALDERVMAAMQKVPRHLFVPGALCPLRLPRHAAAHRLLQNGLPALHRRAYDRSSGPQRHEAVLEIGTGLGYHAAVLAELAGRVWSVEIVEEFASDAEARLRRLGYGDVGIRVGDGSRGSSEHAPFNKILVRRRPSGRPRLCLRSSSRAGAWSCPWELKKDSR